MAIYHLLQRRVSPLKVTRLYYLKSYIWLDFETANRAGFEPRSLKPKVAKLFGSDQKSQIKIKKIFVRKSCTMTLKRPKIWPLFNNIWHYSIFEKVFVLYTKQISWPDSDPIWVPNTKKNVKFYSCWVFIVQVRFELGDHRTSKVTFWKTFG